MPNQREANRRGKASGRVVVHGLRIALFVLILWLIRDAHRDAIWNESNLAESPLALEFIQKLIPNADSISNERVLDATGNTIGSVLQTSPQCDRIIGYSGPTNCLIALDIKNQILSIEIANSGDTVDHVAAVKDDPEFAKSFQGIGFGKSEGWRDIDAVSGATLTSYAIIESVAKRMGGSAPSLKFSPQPDLEKVRTLFDDATKVDQTDRVNVWKVSSNATELGSILSTTPIADELSGYQGPTMTLAGFDVSGKCVGLLVDQTYENQPYASYLDDDRHFQKIYLGKTIREIAKMIPEESGIDGVSGATMTSICVAEGLALSAADTLKPTLNVDSQFKRGPAYLWADMITVLLVCFGVALSFGKSGKLKSFRLIYLIAVIVFLGFINGHILSQASVVGWAKNGIPWRVAPGLTLLSLAALLVPIFSKHQPYCHHICPFGALQQLTKKRIGWTIKISQSIDRLLRLIPYALLLLVVVIAMTRSAFNLASIEPFDGFAFRVAGWATITIFVVGLLFSLFSPMAYCRYGCPTGALLGFLKFRADSHRIGTRDWAAILLLAVAMFLRFT